MAKKKRTDRRTKQRAKVVQSMTQNILDNLARIEVGKTPPEIAEAKTEYYKTLNEVEKSILLEIFKLEEDKITTDIANFYAEKFYKRT